MIRGFRPALPLLLALLLAGPASVLLASPASALIIEETFDGTDGQYEVTNDTGIDVFAFAVSNDDAFDTWSERDFWEAQFMYASDWPEGLLFGPECCYSLPDTTVLNWFDYFEPGIHQAIMFYLDESEAGSPLLNGETDDAFFFSAGFPASNFVAFDADGNVVSTGETLLVPEPATLWLLASAAGLLARRTRRS